LSIIKLGKDNFERFSVIARPTRAFSSSSYGVTGSVPVFARSSTVEKEVEKPQEVTAPVTVTTEKLTPKKKVVARKPQT
jgi:hypothetical protein